MIKPLKYALLTGLLLLNTACNTDDNQSESTNPPQTFQISDGLEVRLIAPNDFNLTQEHYGFAQAESFSRIRIEEKELPYIAYTKSLTKENLLKNKLQLLKQEQIDLHGSICTLFTLRQNIAGTYFEKLWLIAGDDLSSILIEASYPEGSNEKHRSVIKKSLLSLTVATDQNKRLYTGLPFKLTDTPGFKVKQRFANSVILESIKNDNNEDSLIVISHGATEQDIEDIQTLSDHFLNNGKHYQNVDIITNEMIKLNDIPALATTANVEVKNIPYEVFQVVSYQKGRFLLIQAQSLRNKSMNLKNNVNNLLNHFKFK
jgi:hypothetical protein